MLTAEGSVWDPAYFVALGPAGRAWEGGYGLEAQILKAGRWLWEEHCLCLGTALGLWSSPCCRAGRSTCGCVLQKPSDFWIDFSFLTAVRPETHTLQQFAESWDVPYLSKHSVCFMSLAVRRCKLPKKTYLQLNVWVCPEAAETPALGSCLVGCL